MWSKRFPEDQVVDRHVTSVGEASKRVRSSVPFKVVKYGETAAETMDIFETLSNQEDGCMFVYVHGGGGYWQQLSKEVSCYPVEPLVKAGIPVVVPNYQLAPAAKLGEIVQQIRKMTENVMERTEMAKLHGVWLGGHSAGTHLLAEGLLKNCTIQKSQLLKRYLRGLVLISGIYDLRPLLNTDVNDALGLDIGDVEVESHVTTKYGNQPKPVRIIKLREEDDTPRDEAIKLSPMLDSNRVTNLQEDFKVYLVAGENDSPEYKRQSYDYCQVLSKKGIKSEIKILPQFDHFDIVENLQNEDYILTRKIISLVKNYN